MDNVFFYKYKEDIVMVQLMDNFIIAHKDCESMVFQNGVGLWYILDASQHVVPIERTQIFVPITSIKRISFKIKEDGEQKVDAIPH